MTFHSEAAKARTLPNVMQYVTGSIVDIGCGHEKITDDAYGIDGKSLPGVNFVTDMPTQLYLQLSEPSFKHFPFDTVFSSHFLEHIPNQYEAIIDWRALLRDGGHLVLYLPDGDRYNNKENVEHLIDMKYDPFLFWFRRCFCGESKDFRGEERKKLFELVEHGTDFGDDRYSFYIVARRV